MRRFLNIFLLLFSSVIGVVGTSNYFLNPATTTGINPVWTLGEQQIISWQTTLDVFNVSIWQQSLVEQGASSQGNVYSKIHSYDQVSNFTWVVQLYDFDFSYSNVFFFWVNPDTPTGFVSAYFNITKPVSASTISNAPTIPPTTIASTETLKTATASFTPTAPAVQSASASASASPVSSSGIASSGKIALGVGLGVGLPILATLAALLWLKVRQSNSNRHSQMAAISTFTAPPPELMTHQPRPQLPSMSKAAHVDPRDYYPELPSQHLQ
ncbi:hypothetical protein DTO207G8_1902 [Paecilomyces variotii]|nr:hypothetical protein DTO195F2_7487 [Paecilomyces variotii]KAJ9257626.1 hypothetical protein DTO207G8_1902 [Paecilomyces variotii]KAJ9372514.1 hypothetical protein DTO282E5_2841 [Paecilomyces variotii]